MKKNLILIITGVVALIVGLMGGYFFRNYQFTKLRGNFQRFNGQNGQGNKIVFNGNGGSMMNRPVQGEILSIDEKGITVKLPDGSSKIILFSDSTLINKSIIGAKSDLKVNSKVLVSGKPNSDGSLTALDVQLTQDGK